jgi:hypothetical protein
MATVDDAGRPDFASMNVSLQAALAAHCRGNYGLALALVAGLVAVAIVTICTKRPTPGTARP